MGLILGELGTRTARFQLSTKSTQIHHLIWIFSRFFLSHCSDCGHPVPSVASRDACWRLLSECCSGLLCGQHPASSSGWVDQLKFWCFSELERACRRPHTRTVCVHFTIFVFKWTYSYISHEKCHGIMGWVCLTKTKEPVWLGFFPETEGVTVGPSDWLLLQQSPGDPCKLDITFKRVGYEYPWAVSQ